MNSLPHYQHSGLISFRIDWLIPLFVQGAIKSLLQHNLKASLLWCSAFFTVQLSHLYMTTGKIITLTIQTFVSKVMSLYFNMLSMFVITFHWRSKCLLISWLQSPSTVIWDTRKWNLSLLPPFYLLFAWSDGTGCNDLVFLNVEF